MTILKTLSGSVAILALGSASMLFPVTGAHAGLTSTVALDTATQLDVSWSWDPEEPDTSIASLSNWSAAVTVVEPEAGQFRLSAEFRHLTDPHPELGENGGGQSYNVLLPPLAYQAVDSFGLLFDGDNLYAYHSPLNRVHTDVYHFSVFRSSDPAQTQIRLVGTHVPELLPATEPASLALAGIAIAGLFLMRSGERARSHG